jgi:putative YjhG/YagF family dehydratase
VIDPVLESGDDEVDRLVTTADGPAGRLPLDDEMLRTTSSGNLFGWTQNVAMGLSPTRLRSPEYLIMSTQGGLRGPDGEAVALGYHTGHWEIGLLVEAAAREMSSFGAIPFAAAVSDPCDGRTNGTAGMLDSLPYRNDAAIVMRRLIRSLPTCRGVLGVASCDKGLPATLMALAGVPSLPSVAVPGGVTLLARDAENTATVQTLSARFARGEVTLDHASVMGCRACGSAGGGCQFMGTAATSQVIAEALGLALPHSALSPSGTPIWQGMARRSAMALHRLATDGVTTADVLTDDSIHNAMVLHAAVGGSTNILLHLPAIAHAAGLDRPGLDDWVKVNAAVPRLVDALPNGPQHFATVQVFLAGGVPEVMLQLASTGALRLDARTVTGRTLGDNLSWWATSERRRRVRARLAEVDGIDPDDVIRPFDRHLPSTVTFLTGSIAPGGAIVKSTAIPPHLLDDHGVYHHRGTARVFTTEDAAIDAIKRNAIESGHVLVLMGLGPGIGMPETYQITAALKAVDPNGRIPLITDGRFSGVSTGPCIGHISPEAWAGGPIGRLRDGDLIDIIIDTAHNTGRVDVVEPDSASFDRRHLNDRLVPDPRVPDDTRLWAALQAISGGCWGGCVYDVDGIVDALRPTRSVASE